MKSLKVLGIINLVAIALMLICAFSGATDEATGFYALIVTGIAIAQSIIGIKG